MVTEGNMPAAINEDGVKGLTFVPDSWLTSSGFVDGNGDAYTASSGGFGGVFMIGHQSGGFIYVFDLTKDTDDAIDFVGKYQTGYSEVAGLELDRSSGILYVLHGDEQNWVELSDLTSFDVEGQSDRRFRQLAIYDDPGHSGVDANLEGLAIRPIGDCTADKRHLFITRDKNDTNPHLKWFSDWPCDTGIYFQTADMPSSWLVLYNADDTGPQSSTAWATWYSQERNIPPENMLGLTGTTSGDLDTENISLATFQDDIRDPVKNLLESDAALERKIMGIIVGFNVPGHFGVPCIDIRGGQSVADALVNMYNDTLSTCLQKETNLDSLLQKYSSFAGAGMFDVPWKHENGRLTKALMTSQRYMTTRVDAPSFALAQAVTSRAKAIENSPAPLQGYVYYDYLDLNAPSCPTTGGCPVVQSGGCWALLRDAVIECFSPNTPALLVPWLEFDADIDQTPTDAIRFGTHDVDGWDDNRLHATLSGDRMLAFNLNSWGATTVRSTTADDARYVPNAIDAGYAAAIGATSEPSAAQPLLPAPDIILGQLSQGWTIGEAFYQGKIENDWQWTLFADPFMTLPVLGLDQDCNGNGVLDTDDIAAGTSQDFNTNYVPDDCEGFDCPPFVAEIESHKNHFRTGIGVSFLQPAQSSRERTGSLPCWWSSARTSMATAGVFKPRTSASPAAAST